ncbi:MAG: sugar transferase [Prochloraceae cyanobacterium]|nr:sugar transferase [Prochloraceae cyanobacterium]
MHNSPGKTYKPLLDIRAPQKIRLFHLASWKHWYILLLSDISALAIAWQFARYLNKFYSPIPPQLVWWVWLGIPSPFWIFAAITLLFFAYSGLYNDSTSKAQNYVRTGQLVSIVYLLSLVIVYFYDPKLDPPRSLFFTAWFGSVGSIISLRLLLALVVPQFKQTTVPVFIIAPAGRLNKLAEIVRRRGSSNSLRRVRYKVVGAALATTANSPATLKAIIKSGAKQVLAETLPQTKLASTLYWRLRRSGICLRLIPSSLEILHRRGASEVFAGLPTLRVETSLLVGWDYRLKRWIDFFGALFGIIILSPLFVGVAIAIKISSPGSIFFRQERVGLHGKIFKVWKFRTMVANAAKLQAKLEAQNKTKDGIMFKVERDPRIIPIGHFLRRTSIDELPQLFNVLLGQMSLVGPRPLPLRDVKRFDEWHHIRHRVLPGITGMWQISGRSDIEDFDDAARLDLYYIDHWSLNLDLDILVETVRIVLFGKGAY